MAARAVSADSHVLEPADLWLQRLDAPLRERAPHVRGGPDGNVFYCEGRDPLPVRPLGTPFAVQHAQVEEGRRGGWDPAARLEDMAVDGIEAEVLYPSLAMTIFSLPDGELQAACFRAYNDWLAEFCGAAPHKLYGVGLIPLFDVREGVRELRRSARLGLQGAAVWGTPPDDHSFASDRYDPFWTEAQKMGTPISLHCFTGKGRSIGPYFLAYYSVATQMIQESLATLIFAGVFERFPDLKVLSVENDIGWVPYLLQRMDYGYLRKGRRRAQPFKSGLLPSDRFRRNVRCTFMTDPFGVQNAGLIGADVLMWATDYPHDDSTWPESQKVLETQFARVASGDKEKIVFSNVVGLYNMRV